MEPLNLDLFIREHQDHLKLPIVAKQLAEGDEFIALIVGGPNAYSNYHYNCGEEFFYQIKGDITLKIIEPNGDRRDLQIKEGEVFVMPARTLHRPIRHPGSLGVLIERKRKPDELDGFVWFCDACDEKLYEEYQYIANLGAQIPEVFRNFYTSEEKRTCQKCGHVMAVPEGSY